MAITCSSSLKEPLELSYNAGWMERLGFQVKR